VDPGYDVAVTVSASLRRMIEIWRGDLGWPAALRSREVEVHGPVALRRAVPGWFTLSVFASVPGLHSRRENGQPLALLVSGEAASRFPATWPRTSPHSSSRTARVINAKRVGAAVASAASIRDA
jgi:hypothetical protein